MIKNNFCTIFLCFLLIRKPSHALHLRRLIVCCAISRLVVLVTDYADRMYGFLRNRASDVYFWVTLSASRGLTTNSKIHHKLFSLIQTWILFMINNINTIPLIQIFVVIKSFVALTFYFKIIKASNCAL
jgi:hypothetical protein